MQVAHRLRSHPGLTRGLLGLSGFSGGVLGCLLRQRLLGLLTRIHAPGFLAEACTSSQRCTSCGCCGVCSCDRSMSHNSGQAGAGAQAMLSESVHTGLACSFRSACSCIISMLSLKADRCRRRKEDMWWPYAPCSGDPLGAASPASLGLPGLLDVLCTGKQCSVTVCRLRKPHVADGACAAAAGPCQQSRDDSAGPNDAAASTR